MEWISVKERLPDDGQVVLIYDGEVEVARFKRGISMEERDKMKRGELSDPAHTVWSLSTGHHEVKRSESISPSDEWGNNKVPYSWEARSGPMQWFGQDVSHWMVLPNKPK